MNNLPEPLRPFLDPIWNWALGRSEGLSRRTLAWGSLGLAGVILVSVNLLSSILFRNAQADLTADRLYTISEGTKQILRAVDEPISLKLYFSKKLGEASSAYLRDFERVKSLLEQYRDLSGGRLELQILDPEPFSDAEDKAVAAGLRGLRLNAEGETGYFGLAATNSTDNAETIAFFSPDREDFLEYDVTKLIYTLSSPKKSKVGLMSGLPLDGGPGEPGFDGQPGQPTPPWAIMSQIREFFDVETLDQGVTEIPSRIDVLMVVQPVSLKPEAAFAIDQFALKGGKVLVFVDPMAETNQLSTMKANTGGRKELTKVLNAWGVGFEPTKVAGDIKHARRVQFGRERNMVTEFVAWLALDKSNMDQADVLSSGIETLNLASAGVLTKMDGATTSVTPIIETSSDAMQIGAEKVGMGADPLALLRNYTPEGKRLMLAARVSGETKSAFPDGAPRPEDAKDPAKTDEPAKDGEKKDESKPADAAKAPDKPHLTSGRVNAIVVADSDMLGDRFWVQVQEIMGQQAMMPIAHNGAFVVGALENLTGSDALIALRGRGVKERRFTLVDGIRRDAEKQFREKEETLTAKLQNVQKELAKLESTGEGGGVVLTDTEKQAVEKFKSEMLDTRRQLRDVKLALRHDIDRLDGWLKFVNIALVPILIGLAGIGWSMWQSRKRAAGT